MALPLLTAREGEVLALAEEGRSNKEIARHLRISSATVKNHIHNILQKLQVGRRGEAVARLRACRADA
jgi:DNA-binding CsgD family transcriptional regulator